MIATHKIGDEKEAAKKLSNLWHNIENEDIFVQWPFPGFIRGLISEKSFFNNSPELELVTSKFNENGGKIQRGFSIGITDINNAKYITVNQDIDQSKIPHYVVTSSSVPGFFKYVEENNTILVDGFTIDNLNLRAGINECRKIVSDDDKITVDVVMTNPLTVNYVNMKTYTSFGIYQRGNELQKMYTNYFYLLDIIKAFPDINWRYIVYPHDALPNYPVVPLV